MSAAVHTEAVEAPASVTEESAGMHTHSTDGKRFNRVNTLARVHYPTPTRHNGHTMPRYVHVKQDINQVSIVAEEMVKPAKKGQQLDEDEDEDEEEMAWLLDDTCDDHVENADIFEKVQKWYHKRFDDGGGHLTVAVCGGHCSGKTHTLLGPAGDAGILPRFLEDSVEYLAAVGKSGKEPTVLLSAFLLEGEDLIDLFNPFGQEAKEENEDEVEDVALTNGKKKRKKKAPLPQKKKNNNNKKGADDDDDVPPPPRINRRVEQSDSTLFRTEASCLGSTIVDGVEVMVCTGLGSDSVSEEARKLLSTAVRTASVIVAQSNRVFYGATLVVRVILVDNPTGKEKDRSVRVVNFVELESFGCPDACTPNEDRLNGSSTRHQGTRLVRDAGRHLPRNGSLSMMHVDKSFLTFYLQDSLFYRSDCYIIGCVRAVEGTVDENFRTLDFLNRIDVLSDDDAPVIKATLLEQVHEGLETEAKTAERWAEKHAVNQERAAAKASRRHARGLEDPSKMPAADAANFHHRHHHSDRRDFAQVYRNKKAAMLALRGKLDMSSGALKKGHMAMKGVLSRLVHWLELWGITRTRKPIWPGLAKLRDPTFTSPRVSVAPGDYLVPLSANGLPTLHGWVGLTFGYTVVSNMSWDAEVHVCEKRTHMGSTNAPMSPALKMALSAALHEADDDDDEEVFERFVKAAKDNGKHTIKEDTADGDGEQLEEGEGELFRTLLVHGEDLELEHCVIQCVAGEIKIRTILRENGTHTSIHVNGENIIGVSTLVDGDIVSFGTTQFFLVRQVTPGGAAAVVDDDEEEDLSDSVDSDDESAMKLKAAADAAAAAEVRASNNAKKKAVSTRRLAVESDLSLFEKACRQVMVKSLMDAWRHQASELIHLKHMEVDRPMAAIAKTADKPPVPPAYEISKEDAEDAVLDGIPPVTQARLCEMGLGGRAMSMLSLTMARDCIARLQLKRVTPDEYARRKRHSGALCWAMGGQLYTGEILVKQIEGTEEVGLWLWARFVFMERYIQAHQMYRRFLHLFDVAGPGSSKPQVLSLLEEQYPHEEDPFLDMPGDELIGVGYVYLDALQYMLDIDENVPLVNFKGRPSGSLRILARVWLDKVTVEPAYVSADEEMRMDKYYNHTCHIRLHLSSLSGIPTSLACKTHAEFKFFFHGKKYRTPDHAGYAPNPFINHTMAITQKITPDFVDFLQNGSLEIEVWGKHASPLSIRRTKDPDSRHQCRHLHLGEPKYVEVIESDGDEGDIEDTDDEGSDSDAEDVETLKAKVEVLQGDLEKANRQLQRATKAVEAYEKKKSWGFGGKKKGGGSSKFDDEDSGKGCGCVLM